MGHLTAEIILPTFHPIFPSVRRSASTHTISLCCVCLNPMTFSLRMGALLCVPNLLVKSSCPSVDPPALVLGGSAVWDWGSIR